MGAKKKKINRRDLLQGLGLGTVLMGLNPYEMLFKSIAEGMIGSANAQQTNPMNYIYMYMNGGAPRWLFDCPLRPNGNGDIINDNLAVVNRFTNVGSSVPGESVAAEVAGSPVYSQWNNTIGSPKYYLPYLWESLLPRSSGGVRSMKELAQHMFIIRGYTMPSDGHAICRLRDAQPNPAAGSLNGIAADGSGAPMPAVAGTDNVPFKSMKGIGKTFISPSGNPLTNLFRAFDLGSGNTLAQQSSGQVETAVNGLLDAMQAQATNQNATLDPMFENRKRTMDLFKRGVDGLSAVYSEKVDRYQNLITRAISDPACFLNGVDAAEVRIPAQTWAQSYLFKGPQADDYITNQSTLNALIQSQTNVWGLARNMAVIEYILEEQLSNSLIFELGGIGGFNSNVTGSFLDMHDQGAFFTMFFYSKYYRAIASCMLELFDRLKSMTRGSETAFDQSVFHLSSEFNRSGRPDGTGSDHGWDGCATSIYSGRIKEPWVVGNIRDRDNNPWENHRGTWGKAATIDELENRVPTNSHVASSISRVLNMPSPTPNDSSLLRIDNSGNVIPTVGAPQNKITSDS